MTDIDADTALRALTAWKQATDGVAVTWSDDLDPRSTLLPAFITFLPRRLIGAEFHPRYFDKLTEAPEAVDQHLVDRDDAKVDVPDDVPPPAESSTQPAEDDPPPEAAGERPDE